MQVIFSRTVLENFRPAHYEFGAMTTYAETARAIAPPDPGQGGDE